MQKNSRIPKFLLKKWFFILSPIIVLSLLLCFKFVFLNNQSFESLKNLLPKKLSKEKLLFKQFCQKVVPLLNKRCSNCHGIETEYYQKFKDSYEYKLFLRWETEKSGNIETEEQLEQAYLFCSKAHQVGDDFFKPIDYLQEAIASPLVRAPLAAIYSNSTHPDIFSSPEDPEFKTLLNWVKGEIELKSIKPKPLSEAEQFFATKVTPILKRKTCFGANCHGNRAFNDLKLDPGIPLYKNHFTKELHRRNRKAMLGDGTRLVNLIGDIKQSKQLLKNIPVSEGGIVHKGGNLFLRKDDPDYKVFVQWLELEAKEIRSKTAKNLGEVQGYIFVRRPKGTPERYFEDTNFLPGADLIWLKKNEEINLTASLHQKPVDIRAPEVSYDGRKVVFAMRFSEETAFNIWELELENATARQLTFSKDPKIHFLDPLYVSNPEDPSGIDLEQSDLVFVSNLAGEWCQSSPDGMLGEVEQGSDWRLLDAQRTERNGTFNQKIIRIVKGTNSGTTRTITSHEEKQILVDKPFPKPCDSTTHYVIETGFRTAPKFDLYRIKQSVKGEEERIFKKSLTRLTYSASQIRRPTHRSSGEIMFTSLRTGWQSNRPYFNGAIYRTHWEGSNFHIHNGNRSEIPILRDNREMPNGLEVRIGSDANSYWGGTLILSDHQFGPNIEPYSPVDNLDHPYEDRKVPEHSEFRFVPGWISLHSNTSYQGISQEGAYRTPYPLPDGSILVSYAKGPIDLADPNAAPDFDILRLIPEPSFHSEDGFKAGKFKKEVLVSSPFTELWPRPVVSRLKESLKKGRKLEAIHFEPAGKTQRITNFPLDIPALLQVYDFYLLDAFFEQVIPVGKRHIASPNCISCSQPHSEKEQIHFARIVGVKPQKREDNGILHRYIIAEVPLDKDGSFYLQIPSGISFDIQSLNAFRMALRSPNRWLYCHAGEKYGLSIPQKLFPQTCGGCHGSLTGKPEDSICRPDAITSASFTLANWDKKLHDKKSPSNYSEAGEFSTITVDFEKDLLPILRNKCFSCHNKNHNEEILSFNESNLFRKLRSFVEHKEALAIKSYLIEKLMGQELKAAKKLTGDTPHPSSSPLTNEELLLFIRWIDLGATLKGEKLNE